MFKPTKAPEVQPRLVIGHAFLLDDLHWRAALVRLSPRVSQRRGIALASSAASNPRIFPTIKFRSLVMLEASSRQLFGIPGGERGFQWKGLAGFECLTFREAELFLDIFAGGFQIRNGGIQVLSSGGRRQENANTTIWHTHGGVLLNNRKSEGDHLA